MLLESQQIYLQVCTPTQTGWDGFKTVGGEKNTPEVSSAKRRACACLTKKENEISENVQELMGSPEQILDCEDLH